MCVHHATVDPDLEHVPLEVAIGTSISNILGARFLIENTAGCYGHYPKDALTGRYYGR